MSLPIGDDTHDLSSLDPNAHGPLAEQSARVRDAYLALKRARRVEEIARDALTEAVDAYAAARLEVFKKELERRQLACCLDCGAIVPVAEIDWFYVKETGCGGRTREVRLISILRACAKCRQHAEPGCLVDLLIVDAATGDEVGYLNLKQARRLDDGTFQIWQGDPVGVWVSPQPTPEVEERVLEVPQEVPPRLPPEIEASLPPLMEVRYHERDFLDPNHFESDRLQPFLCTKDTTEKL